MALQEELEKKLSRIDTRESFRHFISAFSNEPAPARHHEYLIDKLQAVADGKIKRLMVFMPPGSAKSHYANVMFSAWWIGCNPGKKLITASYSQEVADKWGRRVRAIAREDEYNQTFNAVLSQDSQAAGRWELTTHAEYYAVGVGGSVTSYRADLAIIDDPVKGREEADSESIRKRTMEWYKSDLWTRLKPDAAIVLIMTRWHEDDLAGWLLEEAKKGGEKWDVVSLPMEAEEDDPLGRAIGDPLWPEWFKPEMLTIAKRDPRSWAALYQQRPAPIGGGEFKYEWIQRFDRLDDVSAMNIYILIDPATSKKETADWTAMMVVGLAPDNNYYLLDLIRDRLNPTERITKLINLHKKWNAKSGKPPIVGYESYGLQSDVHYLKEAQSKLNYRFNVVELKGVKLRKEERIRRLIPLFEQRRFYLPEGLLYQNYMGEMHDLVQDFINQEYAVFPVAAHDDMIDALARICDEDLYASFPQLDQKEIIDINFPKREEEDDWMNW